MWKQKLFLSGYLRNSCNVMPLHWKWKKIQNEMEKKLNK